ncbi:MAG: WecB/TagA/CpsF family glycosyltransferase [Bacillota bacterium]|nr:WecB/TagA/CpsF family glycosyltransferase [Bacillota bacterium]
MERRERVELLGVRFDSLTFEQAVDEAMRLASLDGPHMMVTANPELLERSRHDTRLLQVMNAADLVFADGVGVVWASRRLGKPLPERVTGIDLMKRLVERTASLGRSVYLLGSRPGVAERAAAVFRAANSGLRIAGTMHGYFSAHEEKAVLDQIREARPSMLFVGLGQPRQEFWIAQHKDLLGVPLAMGIGGSMDVIAGDVRRAPEWMQRAGIEWLYRLLLQPGRIRRHLVLPVFALRVLRESLKRRY